MKTKNVYITPVMEVHSVKLGKCLLGDASIQVKGSIDSSAEGFKKGANDRRSVNEDGLRDWNINLW